MTAAPGRRLLLPFISPMLWIFDAAK